MLASIRLLPAILLLISSTGLLHAGPPSVETAPHTPPSDAIILFDAETNRFLGKEGGEIDWPVEDGALVSTRGGARSNHIVSDVRFTDAQIHVEFQLPESGPGNSGIYLHGYYELQIYNSHGSDADPKGMMGALYGIAPPAVNASRPAGEWQTYDILFHAPKRNDDGTVAEPGSVTALLNGVLVQDHTEITDPVSQYHPYRHQSTDYLAGVQEEMFATGAGPVFLQDHDAPVKFRNVWIRMLE